MNNFFSYLFFILINFYPIHAAVVCNNQGDLGRFGDNLFCYVKAKYLAHKYKLPFLLKPFAYSEKFKMYDLERNTKSYGRSVRVTSEQPFGAIDKESVYSVSFHCEINGWDKLYIDTWKEIYEDKLFLNHLRDMLSLKNQQNVVIPTQDMVSVAVHVRRPSGGDLHHGQANGKLRSLQLYDVSNLINKYDFHKFRGEAWAHNIDACFHFKFLPDQYYIDQIRYISERFNDTPMYVFIFTDYHNPQELVNCYKTVVGKSNIIFETRSSTDLVAEDMISMTYFDCLIRSDSNFAQMAEFLGNHKLIISPKDFAWYQDKDGQDCLVVTDRFIINREANPKYIRS